MPPLVQTRRLTKRYPGVTALDNVDFELLPGEVHIVAGENGAGKSTLMKALAGSVRPDSGVIELDGAPINIRSPLHALQAGISAVYQEFALCPQLTAAENIFLGREPGGHIFVDRKFMRTRSAELLKQLGAACAPDDIIANLGTAQMQLIEIARALNSNFRVLILDEPTAALSEAETAVLFNAIRSLRAAGKTIAYISHRLEEFAEIGDRVTVMRNGRLIETLPVCEATIPRLINAMAGKDLSELFPTRKPYSPLPSGGEAPYCSPRPSGGEGLGVRGNEVPLLRVSHLFQSPRLKNISFDLHAGEILGVAGLVGSGRTRLLRTLFGLEPLDAGRIELEGRLLPRHSPQAAVSRGIGLVPEDRKTQGLLLERDIAANISIANLDKVSTGPFVSARREAQLAQAQCDAAQIKTPSVRAHAATLSGGNQQKVVLARWLARECRVLLLDEPARGVDVGARYEIFKLIAKCADEGRAVLMVSSYLPELLGMCDRILVMHRGELAAEFPVKGLTQEQILHAASVGRVNL